VVTPQLMKWLMTDELGSWRFAFVAVGAIGLLWVCLWLWMMRGMEEPVVSRVKSRQGLSNLLASIHCQFFSLFSLFASFQIITLLVLLLLQRIESKEWFPQLEVIGFQISANLGLICLMWIGFKVARKRIIKSSHQCIFVVLMTIVAFFASPHFGAGWSLLAGFFAFAILSPDLFVIVCGRRFWALALLITGTQTVWHIYRVWLMKFLQTGRGYTEVEALNFNSAYYISTDVGCFAAGIVSILLVRRLSLSAHSARRWVYAGACGLTSLSVLIPWLGQGWLLLAVLLVIGAGALALFPCYYSFVQEVSADHVGRITGLLSMWVWAVTSPLHSLFGYIADTTKSYDAGLVIAGLAPWLGVVAMRGLWGSDK
jgi:hypothetical protein